MFGLVNVDPARLVVVYHEQNLRKILILARQILKFS